PPEIPVSICCSRLSQGICLKVTSTSGYSSLKEVITFSHISSSSSAFSLGANGAAQTVSSSEPSASPDSLSLQADRITTASSMNTTVKRLNFLVIEITTSLLISYTK